MLQKMQEQDIQHVTDKYIALVDKHLVAKEKEMIGRLNFYND